MIFSFVLITELIMYFFSVFIKHHLEKFLIWIGLNPKEHPYKYNIYNII